MLRRWPFVLVAFCYLATSPYHEGLNNPNEMTRVYAAVAFVEHGSFAIDPVMRRWGGVDDKAKRDGKHYSSKAPWQTLVALPAAAAAPPLLGAFGAEPSKRNTTFVIRLLSTVVPSILFAWALLAWCRRRALAIGAPESLANGLGLSLTLGTMLYPYALTATGHAWAGIGAGGAYLALVGLARRAPHEPGWRGLGVVLGALVALTPFAEYPATLAVLPILATALWITPGWGPRAELAAWVGLGGLGPTALGLWAHRAMWGHPFKTGYSFLDNPAYRDLVSDGFFGVGLPSVMALFGALFSVETGLFVFSPVLLVGFAMLAFSAFPHRDDDGGVFGIRRHQRVALAGLTSVTLMFLFISSHAGWRGGWTVGPRYILPVAPLLGLWVVEALAIRPLGSAIAVTGTLSISVTGLSAALYPHLSDVYANPWASFVLPTYAEGLVPYGVAHALGLDGWAALAVHVVPLAMAAGFALAGGLSLRQSSARWELSTRVAICGLAWTALLAVPERDPVAAEGETRRLWALWEPRAGRIDRPRRPKGRITTLKGLSRQAQVRAKAPNGPPRTCRLRQGTCRYGESPWLRFGPQSLQVGGKPVRALHLHPIAQGRVEAVFPVPKGADRLDLYFALTDGSLRAGNPDPVRLSVRQGGQIQATASTDREPGWQRLKVPLTGSSSVSVELRVRNDGARTLALDGDFMRAPASQP